MRPISVCLKFVSIIVVPNHLLWHSSLLFLPAQGPLCPADPTATCYGTCLKIDTLRLEILMVRTLRFGESFLQQDNKRIAGFRNARLSPVSLPLCIRGVCSQFTILPIRAQRYKDELICANNMQGGDRP